MKNFLIDLCLVGMLIFMINGLFNDYGAVSDNEENTLSLVVKEISDGCIKVIETFVLIISNIISSLF